MFDDAKEYVKKCPQCQWFDPSSNRPSEDFHTLQSLWPFMQWGLKEVDPFPRAQPQLRFLLVVMNYFTKWIKAVPLSDVTWHQIVKFLWQNIIYRFGHPHTIISDNETNFANKQVASFCVKYKIVHLFSTLYYPQGNDQADINNHTIIVSLCKSSGKEKGEWVKRLPIVLWAYQTTKRISTGETLFLLAYGTEVIITVDICMPTLRTKEIDWDQNIAPQPKINQIRGDNKL